MVNRRIGKENSETRQALIDAAEKLMREEGYAEVTSRKLARHADLKPQLVHYYFRTMDELFEALFKHVTERHLRHLEDAAQQENPLARLFEIGSDPSHAVLNVEFLALANHRKGLHALIAEFGGRLNAIESGIIRSALAKAGVEATSLPPEEMSTMLETLARGMSLAGGFNADRFSAVRRTLVGWLEDFGATYKMLSGLGKDNPK